MGRNMLIEQSERRFAERPDECRTCINIDGITIKQRNAMRQLFLGGNHSIGEVAKRIGVSYSVARKMLENDDELRDLWETSFQSKMDEVEGSMIERAIDGRNEIAAQQAGEFLLRHRRKDTYGDNAVSTDLLKSLPKIVIAPVVSRSPLQQEVIEVKPE